MAVDYAEVNATFASGQVAYIKLSSLVAWTTAGDVTILTESLNLTNQSASPGTSVSEAFNTIDRSGAIFDRARKAFDENTGWLSAAERSFAFWDNDADARYDDL